MLTKVFVLAACSTFVQTTAAAGSFYGGLSTIKNLWVAGASIDYIGSGAFSYSTTANGPNHINYIAVDYPSMTLQKFAYPGAVTDQAYVPPTQFLGFSPIINWKDQISQIITAFTLNRSLGAASSQDSLFVFTASNTGNDVLNSFKTTIDKDQLITNLVGTMRSRFADLFAAGARNFVFLNVLPVWLTPALNTQPPSVISSLQTFVGNYQSAIDNLVTQLNANASYAGQITIFQPDVTPTVEAIAADTLATGPTAGYENRTGYCAADESVGIVTPPNPDATATGCLVARKYLFHDNIHFTSPAHCEYAMNTLRAMGDNHQPSNCQYA